MQLFCRGEYAFAKLLIVNVVVAFVAMFFGSSAEVGNKNVCGFAIVVVVAPDDAEDSDDLLLESFNFDMRSNCF